MPPLYCSQLPGISALLVESDCAVKKLDDFGMNSTVDGLERRVAELERALLGDDSALYQQIPQHGGLIRSIASLSRQSPMALDAASQSQILEERVAALERYFGASIESEFEIGLTCESTMQTILAQLSQLEYLLPLLDSQATFDPSKTQITENKFRHAASTHLAHATACNNIQANIMDLAFRYGEFVRSLSAQLANWSAQLDKL